MFKKINKLMFVTIAVLAISIPVMADSNSTKPDDIQDMSDPLAVFTQAGFGFTNKGINLKAAQAYDTGDSNTLGMNALEVKGIGGDIFGWDGDSATSNAVDSLRFRNFGVNLTNGRGAQVDISYDLNTEAGSMSYSILQALPAISIFTLYPLAGVGAVFANNAPQDDGTIASGFSVPGVFSVIGMYTKITVTEKIWMNYNPMWSVSLAGSDNFKDYGFEGDSSVLAHEFVLSYQVNARSNVRYFANWTENTDVIDGDHRIEYNYQF